MRNLDEGDRPDQIELTEHVAWFAEPATRRPRPTSRPSASAGYLALTKTHLVFVPYHRAEPVVLDRTRLSSPGSRHKKVWKKSRGSFSLRYQPAAGDAVTVSFKAREAYTWLYHLGYRSGLGDDPYS